MAELAHLLDEIGHATLYTFLDLPPDARPRDLLHAANVRYKEVSRDTAANKVDNELLGYCMDFFSSAEAKEKYDNARYEADMGRLTDTLDAKGTDGILEEVELREVLSTALDQRIRADFAADFVERYADAKGWTLTTDPALVIQKLSTSEPRTAPSADNEGASQPAGSDGHHSFPLIVSVKDGLPIEIPARVVNDRIALDIYAIAVGQRQSQLAADWGTFDSLEAALERKFVFNHHMRLGLESIKAVLRYHGLSISTKEIDSDAIPLVAKAGSYFDRMRRTLEDLEQQQASRGAIERTLYSISVSRTKKKELERSGEDLKDTLGEAMSIIVWNAIARLQESGVEVDQVNVAHERMVGLEGNVHPSMAHEHLPTRVERLKRNLAQHYYANEEGVQGLFATILRLDDWEEELARCSAFFANCNGRIMRLAASEHLQVAVVKKLCRLVESQFSNRQLQKAVSALKPYLVLGDAPRSTYDQRASNWIGDDGAWKAVCLVAASSSLSSGVEKQRLASVHDLRRFLRRCRDGLRTVPKDVVKGIDDSSRDSLSRDLVCGLTGSSFGEGDARYVVKELELVELGHFVAAAAKELQTTIASRSLSDAVGMTNKLRTWCGAFGEEAWDQLATLIESVAVGEFCTERMATICDQHTHEDLKDLSFVVTQICGKEDGLRRLKVALVDTVDGLLNRFITCPTGFLSAVRDDLKIVDDVEAFWASRAAKKVAMEVQRKDFDLSSVSTYVQQIFVGDVPSSFYRALRDELIQQMVPSIDDLDHLADALEELHRITEGRTGETKRDLGTVASVLEKSLDTLADRFAVAGQIEPVSSQHLGAIVAALREGGGAIFLENVLYWVGFGSEMRAALLVTTNGVEIFGQEEVEERRTISHATMATATIAKIGQGVVFRGVDKLGSKWETEELAVGSDVAEEVVRTSVVMVDNGVVFDDPWLGAFWTAQVMRGREYLLRLEAGVRIPSRVLKKVFATPRMTEGQNYGVDVCEDLMHEVLLSACGSFKAQGVFSAPLLGEREDNARTYICGGSKDRIYLTVDVTVWGSNKKGVVVGGAGIYWTRQAFSRTEETYLPWARFWQCELSRDGSKISFGDGNEVVGFGRTLAKVFYGFLLGLQGVISHVARVAGDAALVAKGEREEKPLE